MWDQRCCVSDSTCAVEIHDQDALDGAQGWGGVHGGHRRYDERAHGGEAAGDCPGHRLAQL